ncbi:amidohydrolase family protein, partial [Kitasatospora purpeofusca]|uniref:amidohydrolase family protein n=1 Tax=Kitasatospora purpeofusca TaxID=67352 RepID=UPI0036821527
WPRAAAGPHPPPAPPHPRGPPAAPPTPARLLGLGDRTGSIAPGKDADLVVLTPRLHVRHTVLQGHMIGTR